MLLVCKRYADICPQPPPPAPILYNLHAAHIVVVAYQITIATGACHMPSNIEIAGILLLLLLLLLLHRNCCCLVSSLFVRIQNCEHKNYHQVYAQYAYHEFLKILFVKMQMQTYF